MRQNSGIFDVDDAKSPVLLARLQGDENLDPANAMQRLSLGGRKYSHASNSRGNLSGPNKNGSNLTHQREKIIKKDINTDTPKMKARKYIYKIVIFYH